MSNKPTVADAYKRRSDELEPFFSQWPESLLDGTATIPEPTPLSASLANQIRSLNEDAGCSEAVMKNVDLLANGEALVIATGQQAGIFTGPLYTVYKAIGAVLLAEKCSRVYGRPFVPLFWAATDDHDFDEIRLLHVMTRSDNILPIAYAPATDVSDRSAFRIPADRTLHAVVDKIDAHTHNSEFKSDVLAQIRSAIDQSDSLADLFVKLFARVFRRTGVVLFAPHPGAARDEAAPVLRCEIDEPCISSRLSNDAANKLTSLGFKAQLRKSPNQAGFFIDCQEKRCGVQYVRDRFYIPNEDLSLSREDIGELLDDHPERFSPNAVLRPLVQQKLFPVAAYVAGPGEIAYWAQLRTVFDRFNLPMPVVYPRPRVLLTTPKMRKLLAKLSLSPDDLAAPETALLDRVAGGLHAAVPQVFDEHCQAVLSNVERLRQWVGANEPELASSADKLQHKTEYGLSRLAKRMADTRTKRHEDVVAWIRWLADSIYPNGKPQERVLNIVQFIIDHGWGFTETLLEEVDILSEEMQEVAL